MSERIRSKRPSKKSKTSHSKTVKKSKASAAVAQPEVSVVPDVSEMVVETPPVVETPQSTEEVVAPPTTTRRKVIREDVLLRFDTLMETLEKEIELTRSDKSRNVSLKTFRSLSKDVKRLRNDAAKVMKTKRKTTSNSSSGFKKPVKVSKQIAKFAGWNPEELKSRNDVTKVLCDYIKKNDLQNPKDRREILVDKRLAKILNYDSKTETQPMTYWYLQQKVQHHYK